MSISLSDTLARLEAIIKENAPSVDIGPGTVFSELLIKLNTTLQNPIANDIDALSAASSITKALNSPTDTYSVAIDEIASNYNTARGQGQKSAGVIKVVVSSAQTYIINQNFVFIQPNLSLNYLVTGSFKAKVTLSTNPVDASELQLYSQGNLYYFLVPVIAENAGGNYQLSDNTNFTTQVALTNFVEARAYGNFTSGLSIETDKELIARFQSSLTNKTLLSENSIKSRLLNLYPSFQDVSLVGANDGEMTRSKQNLFGISTLGVVDVYIRTSFGSETKVITKEAAYDQNDGLFHVSLDNTDAAGFYRIVSITPSGLGLGGSLLHTDTYGFETQPTSNLITSVQEARFTKYQTCSITFDPSDVLSEGVQVYNFDIVVSLQPNIASIQDLFLSSSERIVCADYLIKGAVPCYVSVDLKIYKKSSLSVIPVETLKQDIFNYVNSIKFGENLNVSEIIKICHKYDISHVKLPITVNGDIYAQDSSVISFSSRDVLEIPTNLAKGVSPKTTAFVIDYFKTAGSSVLDSQTLSDAIGVEIL